MVKQAFKVAYIGTDFHGFQRQPDQPTVEGKLLEAFKKAGVMDDPVKSKYSIAGRTDKGVHAMGNVVTLKTESDATINQINFFLPPTIQIIGRTEVPNGFKPRYAESRHYKYVFFNDSYDVDLDLTRMQGASKIFEGTHNFQNFSKRSERDPTRNIKELTVSQEGDITVFDVVGESFLWNMVRKMIQVITMVGKGKLEENDVEQLLNPDTPASISPAPPEGLILMSINYKNIEFTDEAYAKNNFFKTLKEAYIKRRTIAAAEEEMFKILTSNQKSE